MRMRSMFIMATALTSAVLLAGGPAIASTTGQSGPAGTASQGSAAPPGMLPGATGLVTPGLSPANPARRLVDNVFNGISCTTQPDNPSITSTCTAVGFYVDGPYVDGLLEFADNGKWYANMFGGARTVTDPLQVSCVPQQYDIPTCVAVGETYSNPKRPVQMVATGDDNGIDPIMFRNPKGATWSVLDDVSCASTTFCMLVGAAGKTRGTGSHLRYLSHASAYRWNGSSLRRLSVPAPPHTRTAALASVSCPTETSCMAVGDYVTTKGRFLPYSALWSNGSWSVHAARTIRGKSRTIFQAVSCAAAASCVAVGNATKPGSTAFAEQYANGAWTVQRLTAGRRSAFYSVSCPTASYCAAVGMRGTKSLIQAWDGAGWTRQAAPTTKAPFTTDGLLHVSCLSPTICTAVGFRHNPRTRYTNHTLALGWNGTSWAIQATINQ